jgi:hypothetical protein
MIISHAIRPFRYEGIALSEYLWVDGKPCFTAAAIGEFLGLKRLDAVQKIIRRNPFIEKYSQEIETVQQKEQKTGDHIPQIGVYGQAKNTQKYIQKVYNPVGFWLIVFKARTPRAEQCQIMAAVIMDAFICGKLVQRDPEQAAVEQLLDDYLMADSREVKFQLMARARLKHNLSHSTFFRWVRERRKNRSPYDKHYRNGIKPQITGELESQIRGIFSQNHLIGPKEIWQKIGSPKHPSYTTVLRFYNKLMDECHGDEYLNLPGGDRPALGSGNPEKEN